MTTQDLMSHVCPKISDLGWSYYFTPETMARGRELGLDGLRFYFLGRGGVLGDVESGVVHSAFGYFERGFVDTMWTSGREVIAPRVAGREYVACAAGHGRLKLGDVGGLDAYNAAASVVNAAADDTGLSLYAGARCEPFVDDAPGRAMQLTALLRELRGSAHLLAVRAVGLSPLQAHTIKRPGDLAMFGWTDADAPDVTDELIRLRADAEVLTDDLLAPAYRALDAAGQQALITGIDAIQVALTAV